MKNKLLTILFVIVALGVAFYFLVYPAIRVIEVNDVEPVTTTANALFESPVIPTFAHPAEGVVKVLDTDEGKVIRYEDFKTIDGPRLNVYLVRSLDNINDDIDNGDFIDLGLRKGTSGSINYSVPDDINIGEYSHVVHWCVPFGVLFNSAEI